MNVRAMTAEAEDRCELCGYRSDGTAKDRMRHLRGTHPAYARGVLLRLAAPMLFLAEVLILGALRAPQWAFLVAFFSAFAMLFAGKQISRNARRAAGTTPVLPLKRLMREGGLAIVALVPIVIILIIATSR